ncbi:unnamed protein product, partial [Rotaria sordida]
MYSTKLFYDHTKAFRYTGVVKVWMQGYRAVSLIIKVRSSNKQITIPIRYIQKTLLVNTGHDNQPIQIILMLNSAVKIEENDSDNNRCTRIGNDDIPNSFTDIVSKSNALLLQFDPPVNAWSFLLSLPIVGHTDNNKRQDGNLQINFASFTIENWSNVKITVQPRFNSFKSQYSIEMLHSLGYVFTDKYLTSLNAQQSFIKIERDSMNEFHNFCSRLYKALKENHCLCLDDFIRRNTPNTNKINDTFIDMISADNLYVFIRDITLTPMRVIFNPSDIPSVFQIRMAGCKGVLMIDPESLDKDYYVKIRDSMVKFPSDDWTLNICDYSRLMPLSLNNQIIRLLSDLGNKFAVFESLQNRMSKPAVWHSPEDTYLNVFDSELINEQQSRYLNV